MHHKFIGKYLNINIIVKGNIINVINMNSRNVAVIKKKKLQSLERRVTLSSVAFLMV